MERSPASGIMTLTLPGRFDDLMAKDLLIYPGNFAPLPRHKKNIISLTARLNVAAPTHSSLFLLFPFYFASVPWIAQVSTLKSASSNEKCFQSVSHQLPLKIKWWEVPDWRHLVAVSPSLGGLLALKEGQHASLADIKT